MPKKGSIGTGRRNARRAKTNDNPSVAVQDKAQALARINDVVLAELTPTASLVEKENAMTELYALCKEFPSLMDERLDICWQETLLIHLLWIDVQFDSFVRFYALSKQKHLKQLQTKGTFGFYPIHRSCMFSSTDDIPFFLARQAPAMLSKKDDSNDLPLHKAMRRQCTTEFLTTILEFYPESASMKRTLSIALYEKPNNLELFRCIMTAYCFHKKELCLEPENDNTPLSLSIGHVDILCKLLSNFEVLHVDATFQDTKSFALLMKELAHNQSVCKISQLELPAISLSPSCTEEYRTSVRPCLQANSTLKCLHLNLPSTTKVATRCIDVLLSALTHNKGMREFSIDIHEVSTIQKTAPACLQMLRTNAFLKSCLPWESAVSVCQADIAYYLELNRLGRSQAQRATRVEDMIALLTDPSFRGEGIRWSTRRRTISTANNTTLVSIAFDLLCQSPAAWLKHTNTNTNNNNESTTGILLRSKNTRRCSQKRKRQQPPHNKKH